MSFESRNPTTGELLETYPEHTAEEVELRLQGCLGWLEELVAHSACGANRLSFAPGRSAGAAGR